MSAAPDHAIRYRARSGDRRRSPGLTARFAALLLAASIVGAGVGCGSTVQDDSRLTVYVSVPMSGKDATLGKAVLAGAEKALEDAGGEAGGAPVRIEVLDDVDDANWTQATVAANARASTQDSTSIAYIGELEPNASRISIPITNEAGLLQLSAGPVAQGMLSEPGGNDVPADLQTTGDRTFGTVAPVGDTTVATFGRVPQANSFYPYGYESMAVILDSIDRAEDPLSRADVVAAFLATQDRQGKTGTYSIGPDGAAAYADG